MSSATIGINATNTHAFKSVSNLTRANILNGNYIHMGAGVATSDQVYWTLVRNGLGWPR